jgi:putative membrane protein
MVPDAIRGIDRPNRRQLTLYLLGAALGSLGTCGVGLPFILLGLIPVLIRYWTMRYRFEDEGVGVQWGYFFRHESYLTYDKIQDIHLNRGLLERWLGLGTVDIQTASGSAGAEISLIGLTAFDEVRDYLYGRMRSGADEEEAAADAAEEDALTLLRSIRDEVAVLRKRLAPAAAPGEGEGASDA